jgi:hypothetical protein
MEGRPENRAALSFWTGRMVGNAMRHLLLLMFVMIGACDRGPEAPTAVQNQQMNDAEAMLDEMASNEANAR